jgi:ribosomal protein S18 acetylase RimI-like enzyme
MLAITLHMAGDAAEIDLQKLVTVYRESSLDNVNKAKMAPDIAKYNDKFKQFIRDFLAKPGSYFAWLEADEKYICALRIARTNEITNSYFLEALETLPEWRKQGCASTLIRGVIDRLAKNGKITIRCNIRKDNMASIRTHEKIGFKINHETDHEYVFEFKQSIV